MEIKNRIIGIIIGIVFIIGIITFYYTFSLGDDYQFSSDVYLVENGYVKDISPYTDINLYKKYFDYKNCYVKVVSKSNTEVTSGYVYSGSRTILYDDSDHVISSFTNVVYGDYYADGIIDDSDFSFLGKYLVHGGNLEDYEREVLDINKDGEVRINDLVMLRDASVNGVSNLISNDEEVLLQTNEKYRLIVKASPSYGVNTNLKWTSSNNSIVTVNEAGVVTGGSVEGHATITAATQDGKKHVEIDINLDNTVRLSSTSGVGYVNGNNVVVNIKAVKYDDLTCSVNNPNLASCRIEDKKLVITGLGEGNTEVHVNSILYGSAVYYLQSHTVYFKVMPSYLCAPYNRITYLTVSGFNSGDLSFSSTDSSIISDVRMGLYDNRNMLRVTAGNTYGRAIVTVTENHANSSGVVTVDVYNLEFDGIGRQISLGSTERVLIKEGNLGDLSCSSDNEAIATCSIDGNNIVINGVSKGYTSLNIKNSVLYNGTRYNCGSNTYGVLVME